MLNFQNEEKPSAESAGTAVELAVMQCGLHFL